MKKILIVSDYFYPHWTGISQCIWDMSKKLQKDLNITVLTTQYEEHLKRNEIKEGVNIIRAKTLFSISRVKYSIEQIWIFLKIAKNYDIIFINSPFSNIFPTSLIARLYQKKILIFHHGDLTLRRGYLNKIIEKVFDATTLMACMFANKVSTHTRDYAENSRILKHFLTKFTPLIQPITIPDSQMKISSLERLKQEGKIIFGFAGRFTEEKGFDLLFEAIPMVLENLPNAFFVFAGKTDLGYENFFQENIDKFNRTKDNVLLLNLIPHDQMASFYKNIDFIILPSRSDCFPLVQAEAMLCEKPAVVADIPGLRFLVKETGFGVIIKDNKPESIATSIKECFDKKDELKNYYPQVLSILNNDSNLLKIEKFIID